MPIYFFDLRDNDGFHFDETGVELPDADAAQRAVEMSLPRIAADKAVGSGGRLQMEMIIRDDGDRVVMTASFNWSIRQSRAASSLGATEIVPALLPGLRPGR